MEPLALVRETKSATNGLWEAERCHHKPLKVLGRRRQTPSGLCAGGAQTRGDYREQAGMDTGSVGLPDRARPV